jgi:hypothetical protein
LKGEKKVRVMKTVQHMKTSRHIITCVITLGVAALVHQASAATVDLGTAANFSILGGTAVTFTPPTTTVIGGDVGVSPGTSITGAGANLSQSGGVIHNNDAVAAGARADTTLAYGSAAGALPTTTYLGADNQLGGLTLTAGTYRFGAASTANLIGNLTLSGPGVFIFQATSSLVTASGSSINLINGADACNIIWQVGSSATLGSGSFFDGTILAQASITSAGGSTIAGRLLAGTGNVTLIGDTIVTDRGCQPGQGTGTFFTTGVPGVVAGVPDSGSSVLLLGLGLGSLIVLRTISRQSRLQAGC